MDEIELPHVDFTPLIVLIHIFKSCYWCFSTSMENLYRAALSFAPFEPLTSWPRPLTSQLMTNPAIYFQVAHSHSVCGKWLRWPFWPQRAHIMVSLIEDVRWQAITLKGRQGRLLGAGSMPTRGTKECVCDDTAADNFSFSVFTRGSEQQGVQMILDDKAVAGNQWDKAILEKKNPFLSCYELMPLSCPPCITSVCAFGVLCASGRVLRAGERPESSSVIRFGLFLLRSVKIYALWGNYYRPPSFCCVLTAGSFSYISH